MVKRIICLCALCAVLFADSIQLKNGKTYNGTVKVVGNKVTVVSNEGIFQFPKKDVSKMNGEEMKQDKNPVVKISTSKGDLLIELFEDEAPNTVANFIELAEKDFYKGMAFHRVIPGFMAQGGCPNSKRGASGMPGTGGPGYCFDNECVATLKHDRKGILSMANAGANTNGSQFFICFTETPWLNGKHTVFGVVIDGMDVLDKLEAIGSQSGRCREDVRFNVEVVSKRDHEYHVKKNNR